MISEGGRKKVEGEGGGYPKKKSKTLTYGGGAKIAIFVVLSFLNILALNYDKGRLRNITFRS